jgi:hypothetical protein
MSSVVITMADEDRAIAARLKVLAESGSPACECLAELFKSKLSTANPQRLLVQIDDVLLVLTGGIPRRLD